MWVNFDSFTNGGWSSSLARYDSNYNSWILIGAYDGNFAYTAAEGGNGYGTGQTTSLETNRWYHLVGTVRNGTVEGWLDGQMIETNTGIPETGVTHSSSMNWAISSYNDGRRMDGQVCDVRIYNRALSPQEIQTLYEWGSGDYASPPTNGTAYYPLDGNATDKWGSNDGTVQGDIGWVNGIRGKAAYFSGDEYIDTGITDLGSSFSLSAWAILDNSSPSKNRIFGKWNDNDGYDVILDANNDNYRVVIDTDAGAESLKGGSTTASSWKHVSCTWDGNTAKLYENGNMRGSLTPSSYNPSNDRLAISAFKSDRRFKGKIDDARIYNRALSPSEVFQLYQWGTRGRDMRKLTVNARGDQ